MQDCNGIIFDVDHFAVHDGPGIRTVVYLKGCPLRCVWCHSPESQSKHIQLLRMADICKRCESCQGEQCPHQAVVISGRIVKVSEIVPEVVQDKVFFDSSGGGVTLSGGEALYQPEFAEALLAELQSNGIHTVVETSGMGKWENLEKISRYTDLFYYDMKSLDSDKHILYTGAGNGVVLDNLRKLLAQRSAEGITLRLPLIPGYNDSTADISNIYRFAQDLGLSRIHLLRYNTSAPAKYTWLDLPYLPGSLQRQNDEYIDTLRRLAPEGLHITAY